MWKKNPKREYSDSSEATPKHEKQEPVKFKAPEVCRSTHKRQPPIWHGEYFMEINVACCVLTED